MTEQERERACVHWLCRASGMNSGSFLRDLEQAGTARAIYEMAARGTLADRLQEKYKRKAERLQAAAKECDVDGAYEEMCSRGISFVTVKEAGYPKRLAEVQDAPYVLYYAGKLPDEEKKSLAVIGARDCTEYGRTMAREFGSVLARAGVQIVSGMARGIDGISQRAALSAAGYSLGVFGCGVDVCYPRENRDLYEQLLARGGVCSEHPPGIEPRAALFPPRNRIISGLCDGVLVLEAKERSGTLITVDMALEQGREVYAVPGRATDALSAGCNRLIRQGAALVTTPEELLGEMQAGYGTAAGQSVYRQQELFLSEGLQGEVLRLLDFQPQSIESLQEAYRNACGESITVPQLCQELLRLCADGRAGQTGGCYYLKKDFKFF